MATGGLGVVSFLAVTVQAWGDGGNVVSSSFVEVFLFVMVIRT